MFYLLSKLLAFLLIPFNWIVLLFIIFLIVKNKAVKKKLMASIIIIFIIFSNPYLFYKVSHAWQINEPKMIRGKQYAGGIILGGLTSFDKNGTGYFNEAGDRFIQTLKLYNQHIIQKIIVTGGSGIIIGNEPVEGNFLQQEFLKNKVNPQDLIIENKSRNTFENAVFTKHILDSLHINDTLVLISSATHLRRASKVFFNVGITTTPYPSDFEVLNAFHSFIDYIWPNLSAMYGWTKIIKEVLGTVVYGLTGKA